MSEKAKKVFVVIFQWLLKEWVKALLAVAAIFPLGYLGWVYRTYIKNWLVAKHSLETYGWTWMVVFSGIICLTLLFVLLFTRKNEEVCRDKKDAKLKIEDWWQKQKYVQSSRTIAAQPLSHPIECSKVDCELRIKRGFTKRFLSEIIKNDSEWSLTQVGKNIIKLGQKISPGALKFAQQWIKSNQKENYDKQ